MGSVHGAPVPSIGHTIMLGHAPGVVQLTSHLHEPPQSIDGHALWPTQVMRHAPELQVMGPHGVALLHLSSQVKPGGQSTMHAWPALHATRQVMAVKSHDVHSGGQSGVSTQ